MTDSWIDTTSTSRQSSRTGQLPGTEKTHQIAIVRTAAQVRNELYRQELTWSSKKCEERWSKKACKRSTRGEISGQTWSSIRIWSMVVPYQQLAWVWSEAMKASEADLTESKLTHKPRRTRGTMGNISYQRWLPDLVKQYNRALVQMLSTQLANP